ncbi:hypothetical protein LDO48_23340 [Pantoea agglomerans]|nr:hypothetical protein [Pantoea agglomerans]
MSNYFVSWLRRQVRYFVATLIPAALIIVFGMLAVTFWPALAWSSTAIFTVLVAGLTFWLL